MSERKGVRKAVSAKGKRLYQYEFPKRGVDWYAKKIGSVLATSRAQAKKELVKRGLLEPFEARVAEITLKSD